MLKLTFRHDGHVTRNTYRFEEMDGPDTDKLKAKGEWVIGKLYIQKFAFHHTCPDKITINLEW
ncbi:hypothetical protein IID24_04065 [Patescibacteria group bacterium]|nr:hypothetical protein [Patescibacteria group bacterium]